MIWNLVSKKVKIYMFADDTKMYKEVNDIHDCVIYQKDQEKASKWSRS